MSSPEKEASSGMLEEVVVTGMVATNKRLFTGAADKLSASDVKIDGMADISRGWRDVPLVCPSRIFRAPLVQHPKNVCIAGLNPDDIESFQILKDGSATSIYRAKAMVRVFVITTKKGKQGNSSFSYTGEFTTRLKPNYQTFNIMDS